MRERDREKGTKKQGGKKGGKGERVKRDQGNGRL